MTNEKTVQEVAVQEEVKEVAVFEARETENYHIQKTTEGKFTRKAKYHAFSSITAETREQKIKMMQLLNGDIEAKGMNEHVNAKFKIVDTIFNPYDVLDEDTGELTDGVLTYLFTDKGDIYVTSSKSVYFTLTRAFKVFGEPHYTAEEALEVQVVKKKGQQFQYIDLKIIG